MKFKIAILFFIILFVQSCIPSLHPLWTEDTLVFEEKLLGEWFQEDSDGKFIWNFSGGFDEKKNRPEDYDLIYTENKSEARFDIHLVKLGDHLFFDIYPDDLDYLKFEDKTLAVPLGIQGFGSGRSDEPDIHLNSLYFQHMLPVHTFAKVEFGAGEVKIFQIDMEWLGDLFEQRKVRIKHEKTSDGGVVLTAPTEDLQKFFEKYAEDPKAFMEPIVLKRSQ